MSSENKDVFSRWLPALVALVGFGVQLAYTAKWAGAIESRLGSIEEAARNAVPRQEYAGAVTSRNTEMADFRRTLERFDLKLDAIRNSQLSGLSKNE